MNTTANQIKPGDTVTYCGETFRAQRVHHHPATGLVEVIVAGQLPQFIAAERDVDVRRPAPVEERPFVVLTRRYLKSGDCRKGRHTFRTAAAQQRFIRTTTAAVTFHN